MPEESLIRTLLLPKLALVCFRPADGGGMEIVAEKRSKQEYCPRCATRSVSGYDRRRVVVKDDLFRGRTVRLVVHKRRLWCKVSVRPTAS